MHEKFILLTPMDLFTQVSCIYGCIHPALLQKYRIFCFFLSENLIKNQR